jgi:hemoglobin-like flavoprotein
LDPVKIGEFAESLSRCLADGGFLDRFYELFVESSPEIAEKFRETDFERQKQALSSSLYVMVMALERQAPALAYLERIARRHGRQDLDIRPGLYAVWLDCLVRAAKEYDPLFSKETEQLWRESMQFGIEFMQARY